MFNLVIFGAPGSGKGTQSEKLIDRYGLTHISTGDVLRKEIAAGSELGKIADSYISKGQLIPDDLMVDILASEFDRLRPESKGFIFDGFPRTIPQAEALKKMLEDRGEEVHSVIGLEVADEELMERLIKRGAESGRSDDNPETIGNRLKVYHSTTSPLRDYYTAEGTYRAIQGSGRVDEIFSRITEAIESQAVLN
ncbi:adenylate kinase [Muribaculaceae bacterium Isolate-039 (Harlan)]|jgi:adenylate kinase|uniref:adenylate kinase n=1 Tax=Duncaniella TaxID=2518495 RepID=UPI000F49A796|nr:MULTISPECIES: adenylate kinase [Duncaniella]NBH92455.1 adenylate kinase [Muribaculaceae bacterium S4]NBI20914.1 adenylate kinase [Muribaculaceae bacterium Z1]ROS90649.1 adenylate kinase [Muribaculaceae bacterium Isolate-039 (Harlan)]ROS96339.1 adenylate kinase [Muribaculaceae bacterium Isolate-083 (Janvier)]ROS96665.1 adenylate kinase [Muribaculaceae bacterium Isolate-077 (Janvier)]ROT00565.1 adenylate kinase [Muribaculaceae bacterium Isolate-084 (Janvier)]